MDYEIGGLDDELRSADLARKLRDVQSLDDISDLVNQIPSTTRASDEELLVVLKSLVDHFEKVELPKTDLPWHVDLTASSWLSTVYRMASSTAQLIRASLCDGAVATVRVAFEHAIYLSLIADSDDVLELLDSLEGKYLTRTRSLVAMLPDGEELTTMWNLMLEELDVAPSAHWVRDVQQVTRRLATGDALYAFYRLLSGELHPGLGAIGPYLLRETVNRRPSAPPKRIASVHAMEIAVGSCVFAGWAADRIYGVALFAPVVNPIASKYDFVELTRIEL